MIDYNFSYTASLINSQNYGCFVGVYTIDVTIYTIGRFCF